MATDPRAENCRAVSLDAAGKVNGVELQVRPLPSSKYELVRVELIDEAAAAGNTVATCTVLDRNGIQTGEKVFLAWPWPNPTNAQLAGNPNGQHMITNGYTPPDLGPLALFVGDAAGNPISDIVGGLGLPWKRHVCFKATWRERVNTPQPEPDPEPDPETPSNDAAMTLAQVKIGDELAGIRELLGRLVKHFGA